MKIKKFLMLSVLFAAISLQGCSGESKENIESSGVVISYEDTQAQTTEQQASSNAESTIAQSETSDTAATESTALPDGSTEEVISTEELTSTEEIISSEEATSSDETTVENPTDESKPAKKPDPMYDIVNAQYAQTNEGRQHCYAYDMTMKALPCINISTQDGQPILSLENYIPSVVDVYNCDSQFALSANAQVKVRGNSSAKGTEKPYRIKFESKQSMLGLHDGLKFKSWVLLRTYWSVVPDFTAFKLGKTIFRGEYYVSDATYVNVFVNNEFKGVYLLCEQNQAAKNRVEVHEAKEGDTSVNIGYFLELGGSAEHPTFPFATSNYVVTDIVGTTRKVENSRYAIRSDINTDEQKQFIANYMAGVFRILYEASMNNTPMMFDAGYNVVPATGVYATAYQAVEAVFDVKSVAETLILEELCHDNDVGEGSFYMAVDFSADSKYKKLTFCAPWDFSWAFTGNASGSYYACTFQPMLDWGDNSNPWLIMFMRIPEFQQLVRSIWAEVKEPVVQTTNWIDSYADTLRGDFAGYTPSGIAAAHKLQNFVRGRVEWLSTVWG